MVQCCVPCCNNRNDVNKTVSYYRFPPDDKEKRRWLKLIRRDFTPNCNSRVCGWHFPNGKAAGPTLFAWNEGKAFPYPFLYFSHPIATKREQIETSLTRSVEREICPGVSTQTDGVPMFERVERAGVSTQTDGVRISERAERVMQEIELYNTKAELKALKEKRAYCRSVYSASQLSEEALKMETGITDRDTFNALVEHLSRTSISYSSGWSVKKSLMLEDQVLLTLMKLNHKYVDRHLASLFHCCTSTVTNVTTTFMAVLQSLPCVKHMFTPALFTKLLNWKPQVKGTCAKKSSQQTEAGAPSHPSVDLPPLRSESPAGNASPDPKRLCPKSGVLDCDKPGDQTLTNDP